jgi:hypothetical protein
MHGSRRLLCCPLLLIGQSIPHADHIPSRAHLVIYPHPTTHTPCNFIFGASSNEVSIFFLNVRFKGSFAWATFCSPLLVNGHLPRITIPSRADLTVHPHPTTQTACSSRVSHLNRIHGSRGAGIDEIDVLEHTVWFTPVGHSPSTWSRPPTSKGITHVTM